MRTFTFNELDERGQEYAIANYWADSIIQDFTAQEMEKNADDIPTAEDCFMALGWRFNEHGERIA